MADGDQEKDSVLAGSEAPRCPRTGDSQLVASDSTIIVGGLSVPTKDSGAVQEKVCDALSEIAKEFGGQVLDTTISSVGDLDLPEASESELLPPIAKPWGPQAERINPNEDGPEEDRVGGKVFDE